MSLVRWKGPTDIVAGLDPKFIRQEGQSLTPPAGALCTDCYRPFFCLSWRCSNSGHQDGCHREQSRLFHFFISLLSLDLLVYKLKRERGAKTVTVLDFFSKLFEQCYDKLPLAH